MHTYDTLFAYFLSWVILILGWVFVFPQILPEWHNTSLHLLISIFLFFLGLFILIIYILALRKQRGKIKAELEAFQENGMQVFTKKFELLLYSRDIAEFPRIIRLFFNLNPLAIIQPNNVKELKKIINLCETYQIPLIPRGRGTSGYGGALPLKNGIVVILTKFQKIIAIDEENLTVEVECGITWENLRKFLEARGFTLQSYPSSGPSSTIGGWVIQGGYGIGSAKFGSVLKSVVMGTLIGTEGREFQITDPRSIVGSCGTLGIILKLKLKIIRKTRLIHIAVSSPDQNSLINALAAYQELKPYFLRFIDHQNLIWQQNESDKSMLVSQNQSGGIITMSFQEEDWNQKEFESLTNHYTLSSLSDDRAKELWDERFYTLRLKRKGPSLVISEVLVPTVQLGNVVNLISKRFKRESYALELLTANDSFTIVMVWFLTDIRKWSLPIFGSLTSLYRFVRSLEVIQIARSNDGLPYSTGLWLSPYSSLILKNQFLKMKQLKNEIDPHGIFNPGKVWGPWIPRFFPILPWYIPIRLFFPFLGVFYRIIPGKFR
ncbi:MAG: FAD-binding oxidoreductase [Candidatus Hodarchaeota archaeon]